MGGSMLDHALEYAEAGHRVFPIWGVRPDGSCQCNQPDCGSPGKHPHGRLVPQGLKDASDNAEVIQAWWRQYPTGNIGLVTGEAFFVVDCDKHEGVDGTARFLALCQQHGDILETACADTGGGGAHFCFAMQDGVHIRNTQSLLVDGERIHCIDVRGEGGYIVAPPSIHASGRTYTWVRDLFEHLKAAPSYVLRWVASHQHPEPVLAPVESVDSTHIRQAVVEVLPEARVAEIRQALACIPPNLDRETWVERVSMPLHEMFGGSQQGFELWAKWCATGQGLTTPNGNPAYRGEGELSTVWRSFSRRHRNPKGPGTFFELAYHHGLPRSAVTVVNGMPVLAPEVESTFSDEEIAWAIDEAKNPGPFPDSVLVNLQGPIAELTRWITHCSRRQDPVLAFAAALGLTSAAIGRRLLGPLKTGADMALAVLAPSGAGKDMPQECIKNLLAAHPNLVVGLFDDTPVHRAQLDSKLLKHKGQCFLLLDEYGSVLNRWLRGAETNNTMSPVIRRLIGHGRTTFDLAVLSPKNPQFAEDPEGWQAGIFAPCLTVMGFATPGQFYEALSEAALIDGFLGRHVVIASTQPYPLVSPAGNSSQPPAAVHDWLQTLEWAPIPRVRPSTAVMTPAPGAPPPMPDPAPEDPHDVNWANAESKTAFEEMATQLDQLGLQALDAGDELGVALLRRLPGQVMKFALLVAVGEANDVADAAIAQRHLEAAYRITRWSADHLAWKLRAGIAADDASRAQVRLLEAIERARGDRVYRSQYASKAWAGIHLNRIWPLIQQDPRLVATEKWAKLRDKPGGTVVVT